MERIYRRYDVEPEETLEYGWVFGITFFLVLFLSQTLSIWAFGEVGSIFSWIILLLWSYTVSYFLLYGSGKYFAEKIKESVDRFVKGKYLAESRASLSRVPEIGRMESMPREEKKKEITKDYIAELEERAHDMGALTSRDALVYIAELGARGDGVLRNAIETAKKENPRFDGWVVLNKEAIMEMNEGGKRTQHKVEDSHNSKTPKEEEVYLGDVDRKNNVMVPANLPVGKLQSENAEATASFMQHLCEGDEQELFTFIRKMRQGSDEEIRVFITDAILMLDRVHEHRVDGAGYVDKQVLEHTKCFSNKELEEIIAILIGSVDYRYSVPEIGIKLSLIRALEYIKKSRKN